MFRIGPQDSYNPDANKRTIFPGQRFPLSAFDQFGKQFVPRWATNDGPTQAAYNSLVQKIGSCVIMVHSQGGNFDFNAALGAPENLKAIIAIEPSGAPKPGPDLEKLKNIPILIVWGDYLEKQDFWKRIVPNIKVFADDVRTRGGKVEWIDLPKIGIQGNTHMLMMDTNSDQIAQVVQEWIAKNNLMK